MVERARNTAAAKRKERERAQVADWLATALNKGPAEQVYGLRACKTKMRSHLLSLRCFGVVFCCSVLAVNSERLHKMEAAAVKCRHLLKH